MSWYEPLLDTGFVPDIVKRYGMRVLNSQRIQIESKADFSTRLAAKVDYVKRLKTLPIAVNTVEANTQHYEVPAEFYDYSLGPRKKYSACYFPPGVTDLKVAEELMLSSYCEKAKLEDGMTILDLGCGWGSLSLWLGEHYPNAKIFGLSNSNSQREYITKQAEERGLKNITIVTGNIIDFDFKDYDRNLKFDRVMSIEMFEHMKNYQKLLAKVSSWMKDDAYLFIHIFTHKEFAYDFKVEDDNSWMARYFFTGGTMPSDDLLLYFQDHVTLVDHWFLNGTHYGKTAECWVQNTDKNRAEILKIFAKVYGEADAPKWLERWRIFFLACAELFNFNNGEEWGVSHYLFQKK